MGDSDAGDPAALTDQELAAYRQELEQALPLAEPPTFSRPRAEPHLQLATVRAGQAGRDRERVMGNHHDKAGITAGCPGCARLAAACQQRPGTARCQQETVRP